LDRGRLMVARRASPRGKGRDYGALWSFRAHRPGQAVIIVAKRGQRPRWPPVLNRIRRAEKEHRPDPGAGRGRVPEQGLRAGAGGVCVLGVVGGNSWPSRCCNSRPTRTEGRQPDRAVVGNRCCPGRGCWDDRAGRVLGPRLRAGTAVATPGHRGRAGSVRSGTAVYGIPARGALPHARPVGMGLGAPFARRAHAG